MRARGGVVFVLGLIGGCGRGGSGSPAGPSSQPQPLTFTVVSGETDAPVAGARVVVAGQTLQSDASGRVTVAQRPASGALLDVVAAGFLDRQTLVRPSTDTYSLWPRSSPTGLSEDFTARVVYTSTEDGAPVGEAGLERVRFGTSVAVVVLGASIQNDGQARRAHEAAAAQVGIATEGELVYQTAAAAPGSGVFFEARVDPADLICEPEVRGYFLGRYTGNEIVGGRVVYCAQSIARASTVAHELGHSLGLGHSSSTRDLMYGFFVSSRPTSLSPREALAVRLMLQRRGGAHFPDDDRQAQVTGVREKRILCY